MYNNKYAMAEGILLRSGDQDLADLTMGSADRLLDSPSDIASQSEHDDDEDWKECDPDYVEDRFRVDRRKLELMIQGGYRSWACHGCGVWIWRRVFVGPTRVSLCDVFVLSCFNKVVTECDN